MLNETIFGMGKFKLFSAKIPFEGRAVCTSHPLRACGLTTILHNIRTYKNEWQAFEDIHQWLWKNVTFQSGWYTLEVFALNVFICLLGHLFSSCFLKHAFPFASDWEHSKSAIFKLHMNKKISLSTSIQMTLSDINSLSKRPYVYFIFRALDSINTHKDEVHSVIAPHRGVHSHSVSPKGS